MRSRSSAHKGSNYWRPAAVSGQQQSVCALPSASSPCSSDCVCMALCGAGKYGVRQSCVLVSDCRRDGGVVCLTLEKKTRVAVGCLRCYATSIASGRTAAQQTIVSLTTSQVRTSSSIAVVPNIGNTRLKPHQAHISHPYRFADRSTVTV